jgi:hypothetical protein
LASWIAVVPMPLEPPWISSVSPGRSRPRSNTFDHTVKKVSGRHAASMSDRAAGDGRHWPAGATQSSA